MDIRPFNVSDLPDLYRICLLTGDSGRSAEGLLRNPDLLGHYYAAPYGLLEPQNCFMLVDPAGACGYVVGTADSAGFARRLEADWFPPLRVRLPEPPTADTSLDARLIRRIHAGYQAPGHALAYPAHLHIDLLPRAQGRGQGRRLMQHFLAHLRQQGVSGVHLGVGERNPGAIAFYERLGFACLERQHAVRWYGLRLAGAGDSVGGLPR